MIRYREAAPTDTAAIATLHAESWRATYRVAVRDDFLDGPVYEDRQAVWGQRMSSPPANRFVFVAEEAGTLAGFACAYGAEHERWGTLLDNLHVYRERQGQGIGKRLMTEVAKWCVRAYPERGLYLGVLEQNSHAQTFYKSLGAADVGGELWHPPGGGSAPVRFYAWTREALDRLIAA